MEILKLLNYLKINKFDIVHSTLFNTNLHARVAARMAGVPVVTIEEQSDYERYNPTFGYIFRFISHILASDFTDKIIPNSEFVRDSLSRAERIARNKFFVIHNAMDPDRFNIQLTKEESRKKINLAKEADVIGCVASLSQRKGHIYLLDAFGKVLDLFPQAKLLLVGDGPLRTKLKEIVDKKEISESVIFTGVRKDIPELLLSMDIYVSASLNEAFGVSLIEAMYMQLPCVATKVGGVPEVIKDGQTGVLVPPRDSDNLAKAIIDLLNNRRLSANMGKAGRKRVLEKFTPDRHLQKLEILWDDLLRQKGVIT